MCGICGKIYFDPSRNVEKDIIDQMINSLNHRGPDQNGSFINKNIGLGHSRLTIIDLDSGKQPISNEDDQIWIIYNGEIYNYLDLRQDLISKGHLFKTKTDTEVILHLYEEEGFNCLAKLRGMFAFAILDRKNDLLFIARDRVGIKPLYYAKTDDSFIFASEIKSLIQDPAIGTKVNFLGLHNFLCYTYTPGPDTVFNNIYKLQPGNFIIVKNNKLDIREYWDLHNSYISQTGPNNDSESYLESLLSDTVKIHMISDVPVGFLLSGGVDSTTTMSLYNDNNTGDIKAFTIGYDSGNFEDERNYARNACQTYGVEYHETTINEKDFFDFLPKYLWFMEELIFEPPAFSLYYVSRMARDYVKVLISGEGGDEAFAGYQTYRNIIWLERLKSLLGPLNNPLSNFLSNLKSFYRFHKYTPLLKLPFSDYYFSRSANPSSFFISRHRELYSSDFFVEIKNDLTIHPFLNYGLKLNGQSKLKKMLYIDSKTWLPDRLLTKADKMTMANSIELRVPLLDHKVMEFAASLPDNYKLRGLNTKYILKKIAQRRIPQEIIKRKKAGFPTPYNDWLAKRKDLVMDILIDSRTTNRGYFQKNTLSNLLIEPWYKSGNNSVEIFNLLIFELWHRIFIDGIGKDLVI